MGTVLMIQIEVVKSNNSSSSSINNMTAFLCYSLIYIYIIIFETLVLKNFMCVFITMYLFKFVTCFFCRVLCNLLKCFSVVQTPTKTTTEVYVCVFVVFKAIILLSPIVLVQIYTCVFYLL